MLALLLAAAVSASLVPLTPQVELAFPNAAPVTVIGPANSAQNAEYPWTHVQTLWSPRQDAAAVRFCWEIGKYDGCQVFLARPGQPTLRLKNSDVKRLLWTADGKYLIGAGNNTVRLWNLVGGMRTAAVRHASPTPGWMYQPGIERLWWRGADLCVSTFDLGWTQTGKASSQTSTTTRYAVPSLKVLSLTRGNGAPGKEAECRPISAWH